MSKKTIRVGSRESALAMWQTKYALSQLLAKTDAYEFEIVPMKTKGDKILDVSLSKVGDKGLFTKELEIAMLEGQIDFAVHSMKDMPTNLVEGLQISAILARHDPSDVLISKDHLSFMDLPLGAKVGTSSLRRRAQLLNKRPDLAIHDIRGNINTRMQKMVDENFDALVLAAAGVERLGWYDKITEKLSFEICLPAVSQGAIGIETRQGDQAVIELVQLIHDQPTGICVEAERALLRTLEGGCQIPIGAFAQIKGERLQMEALVGSLDGQEIIREHSEGPLEAYEALGVALAERLNAKGADIILSVIRGELNHE